ncbi:Na(+)/H(+) antiporter subunit F1 [Fictibacillus phosphorivorans]|uniref:Na(+)/H(+) antiporter subunit F1 n=1 Tax=Fictibacillus phosphorivorans TaxID=1221500 RepID=UPI0020422AA8|nr:Na(+)/H(+) antiporter subunit F1 [Fictibacillus phosphorivorans]MCM3716913.1 Na(+)/H(+) antiporter subunit F1 [Fictibacillus phosphorivorans]MCM3774538.1 Na(+)/H(+) antiporter subunit F1 [Fictibacillus phosphorivorans]
MIDWFSMVVYSCVFVITISILLLLYRAIVGPSNPDRVVALDTIGINLVAITGLMAILLDTVQLNDIILLIGILTFIATVSVAKFLEKGVIIDQDRD